MKQPISPLRVPAAPKRRQVADSLRQLVAGLRAGDRLPSVADLEKHFGVAKSTVEAAVGDLQAEGLIVRRHGSGTFVAEAPTSVRTRSGRIAITSIGLGGSVNIYSALAEALAAEIRRTGADPILLSDITPQQRLIQAQERWESQQIDGYIHIGSLEAVTFPSAPGVIVGEVPEGAPVHQVVVDSYDGGRRAGEYLWSLGHRRVGFIAVKALTPAPLRYQGLADALQARGRADNAAIYSPILWNRSASSDIPTLETALRTLLADPAPPTALFFANDQVAFPALQTLLAWGLRVPQDISVVSFDDTPGLASHTRPALTGLRMPTLALASLAVQTLEQAIQEPDLSFRRLRLPAELIVRESAGPPPSQ